MESVVFYLRDLPRFLIPCYFDAVLTSLYVRLVNHACSKMSRYEDFDSLLVSFCIDRVELHGIIFIASVSFSMSTLISIVIIP